MKLPSVVEDVIAAATYRAGTTIFDAGDRGDVMYLVRSGEVDIVRDGQIVETAGPDGLFGEMAIIEDAPRTATAKARTDCEVLPINQQRFLYMVDQTPFFAIEVMRVMSRRLRRARAAK